MSHVVLAGDIAYFITQEQRSDCTAEFVGGSTVVSMVEVTDHYSKKKYLVQVSELEEI